MKKLILILIPALLITFSLNAQSTIVSQNFEAAGDTWNYSPYPSPYNILEDTWDTVASLNGGAITPQSGSLFWGMRDLDNPNGGGAFRHRLTFDVIDISSYSNVTVSFYYYTDGYDSNDSIFYNVQYDNGTTWPLAGDIELDKNTLAWTEVSINVPSGTNYVRLQLSARQNGGSDYAGFDNIILMGTATGGVDNPTNFIATTASTSEIDLSWTQNGNGNDAIVAWSSDGTFGALLDGATYIAGDTITGGGTVLYNGSNTSYNHTGLSSGTQYFYKAWSVDTSNTYSSGVTDNATTYKDEPSNHVTTFTAGTPTAVSIPLTWNDNDGAVAADTFLVMINTTGTFTAPVDGIPQIDDLDVTDGSGQVNVAHGQQQYNWTGLNQNTHYYFTIYPYTNSGSAIDYKTDGAIPTADTTTTSANTDLIISEVTDPADHYQARFVELYNTGSTTIDFSTDTWYLTKQTNGGTFHDVQLSGQVLSGATFVIATNSADFNSYYGFNADEANGNISGNGDDGYFLYYGGNHLTGTLMDAYGVINQDGTGKDWEYLDGKSVRKRSVVSPNTTWTASEWVITRPADVVNMTPGQHFNYVTWQGGNGADWDTKANWDNGFIPDVSMDVTIASSSNNPVISSSTFAACWDLAINSSASLTINSDTTGQGSLIVYGTPTGNISAQSYVTAGQWHGIASPVSGQTANAYYLNGLPVVWLKDWSEADTIYNYITSTSVPLGDMKGWMIWIEGSTAPTFSLTGVLRSGTIGSAGNMTRSAAGSKYGYTFVGNPFTSTIDWDASSGWTKTNMDNAIYIYKNGVWSSYVGGSGTNGGTRYIAMNQGFFVQVTDGDSSGTLTIDNSVCVKKSTDFLKSTQAIRDNEIIRLQIANGNLTDETLIHLTEDATDGWDGNLDAHKLFSFDTVRPQIYSTANGNMSINSLPVETGSIALDVKGANGDNMTISATAFNGFAHIYFTDEYTGITTDLTRDSYHFVYDAYFTDRFTLSFTLTGETGNIVSVKSIRIFASDHAVNVLIKDSGQTDISVYNLTGQIVAHQHSNGTFVHINIKNYGYYVVKVIDGKHAKVEKVFVK